MNFIKFFNEFTRRGLEYFGLYYSKYRGVVTSVDDPESRGRLKVNCPSVFGDSESDWCLPCGMFSGNNIGAWALPQKGDMVWIEFEAGNVNHAIWSYGWHTKTSTPQESLKTNYHIKTSGGHSILVNDVDGIIQIKIEGGKTFTIDEKTIVHGNGNEPAVLGNKNEDALNLLSTQVSQIYTSIMTFCAAQSAASSSGVLNPLNAGYTSLNTSLTTYSNAFTTEKDTTISATKSEIVKLD